MLSKRNPAWALWLLLLAGCGDRPLEGSSCKEAGEEQCEGTALHRCDGITWVELAPCHATCVASAGTQHEGGSLTVDEVWSCENSPHLLDTPLAVQGGATLSIAAGATVRLGLQSRIVVDTSGRLVAQGVATAPILVTSAAGGAGGFGTSAEGGLNVFAVEDGQADPSVLHHVIIERGTHGLGLFGLSTAAVPPTIEDCTFRDNTGYGILVSCNEAQAAVPDFRAAGNLFFENGAGDVAVCP